MDSSFVQGASAVLSTSADMVTSEGNTNTTKVINKDWPRRTGQNAHARDRQQGSGWDPQAAPPGTFGQQKDLACGLNNQKASWKEGPDAAEI